MFSDKYGKAVRVAQLVLSTICILGLIPNVAIGNGYGCQVGQYCFPQVCHISGFPLPIQTTQFLSKMEHTDRAPVQAWCHSMATAQEYIKESKQKQNGKTVFFPHVGPVQFHYVHV